MSGSRPVAPSSRPTAAALQRAKRKRALRWLAAFVVVPLGVWLAVGLSHAFEGKSLSNLSLEPLAIVVASCLVFFAWTLVARAGLKPLSGIILLLMLAAGAYAIQHFLPGLRE